MEVMVVMAVMVEDMKRLCQISALPGHAALGQGTFVTTIGVRDGGRTRTGRREKGRKGERGRGGEESREHGRGERKMNGDEGRIGE